MVSRAHAGIQTVHNEATASVALEQILRPHVVPLDRELISFRYEHDDKNVRNPRDLADIVSRETSWAARYYDPAIRTGDDVGPGVFVAMDPVATATWGMNTPHLLVLPLKPGARVLNGELDSLNPAELETYRQITQQFACEDDDDRQRRPVHTYTELLAAFRNSNQHACQRMAISVSRHLNIQAIVYPFNSVALADCRATGTAISIVDFGAIDQHRINYYDRTTRIEGDPGLAPFTKALFDEGKDDYYAQSLLHDLSLWRSFRGAFGYFDHVGSPAPEAQRAWKMAHIFKCGPKWSAETDNLISLLKLAQLKNTDRQLATLEIEVALRFRMASDRLRRTDSELAWEYSPSHFKPLAKFIYRELSSDEAGFEAWFRARIKAGSNGDLVNIARHHREAPPDLEALFNLFNAPIGDTRLPIGSDVLQNLLVSRHYGRHSATYIYNLWQNSVGGPPYLRGLVTPDLNRRAWLHAANIRALTKILTHCRDVFANPKASVEDLTQGECAVIPDRS